MARSVSKQTCNVTNRNDPKLQFQIAKDQTGK